MNIGSTIYKLRTAKNLSQEELAERLNVSRQSVSKWETDASVPDLDKLVKLSEIFEVSLDQLVGREVTKSKVEESTPPQVIVQQVPAKDSFFTFNKILGSILLLATVLSAVISDGLRNWIILGFPLYMGGIYYLNELRDRWLWYSFWIYMEKLCEIKLLMDLWSETQSAVWKTALIPIMLVVFVTTSIIWVRFCRKRLSQVLVSEKYNRAILVVLGWLVHLACILLYAFHLAGLMKFGGQSVWLFLSLSSCMGMVHYTTACLVNRKNK